MPFVLTIDRRSFLAGSVLAALLAAALLLIGPGRAMVATWAPGLALAWAAFAWMHRAGVEVPAAGDVLPIYFAALAVQLLHFAEEFSTGFARYFPAQFGGAPFTPEAFVVGSMAAYALFSLTCLCVYLRAATFLMVPVLFFAIQCCFGDAVAHTFWSLGAQGYFPGQVTALAFWLLGPILITSMLGSLRAAVTIMVATTVALAASLTLFGAPPA
jgi:hypothetical protein